VSGIDTRILCPACGREIGVVLRERRVPEDILLVFAYLRMSAEGDHVFQGEKLCVCGKTARVSLIVSADE
jgi:hypothetical protein